MLFSLLLLSSSRVPTAPTSPSLNFRDRLSRTSAARNGDQDVVTNACNGFATSTSNTLEEATLLLGQDVVLVDLQRLGCGRGIESCERCERCARCENVKILKPQKNSMRQSPFGVHKTSWGNPYTFHFNGRATVRPSGKNVQGA
jgi:hypothetical protein